MNRQPLVIAAMFALLSATPVAGQPGGTPPSSIAGYWTDYFERSLGVAPAGYAFAILEPGETILVAHGFQRLPGPSDRGVTMGPETPVHIASISKTITALALLNLLDARAIDPDAPIWPHLRPAFPGLTPGARIEQITVAQLLAHRSGLPALEINPPMMQNLRARLAMALPEAPGQTFVYSNLNYTIARALIEALSGESYERYVRRVVLDPAGATAMSLRSVTDRSFIHRVSDTSSTPFDRDFTEDAGGYGWFGTARDVAAIFARFDAGGYLSAAMRARMLRDRLGLYALNLPSGTGYSSDGHWSLEDGRGSKTAVVIFPGGVVVALVMNTVWDGNLVGVLADGYRQNIPHLSQVEPVRTPSPLVRVTLPWHTRDVRCTTDGRDPGASSTRYDHAIALGSAGEARCAGFRRGRRVTHVSRLERS